jgi:hypothetical protein
MRDDLDEIRLKFGRASVAARLAAESFEHMGASFRAFADALAAEIARRRRDGEKP